MAKTGFNSLTPPKRGNDNVRIEELFDVAKFPDGDWESVRFLPTNILAVKQHWIKIIAGKEKREIKIPRLCIAFDPNNESVPKKGVVCPYCQLTQGKDGSVQTSTFYLANAISRNAQEDEPAKKHKANDQEKKTGFKDINSKTWTPVRVYRLPSSLAQKIQELAERNIVKKDGDKKAYDVSHPKFGIDIAIKYKSKVAGTDAYSVDKGERTPLTDEEKEYLTWDLNDDVLEMIGLMTPEQAAEDFKRMEIVGQERIEDDEDEDEDDDNISLGKSSKKKKSKKKSRDDDDDDEDDEDDRPSKSKKSKKKSKSRDEDEDDEDEDEEPSSKKKVKANKSKSKSHDDDDDDDDDEDDRPSKSKKKKDKSSKKKKSKKKSRDDDDEEDDDIPF